MILEITCEVRERHTRIPRRETFTAAGQLEDVADLIAARFPGKWCVHPKVRIIDDGPSTRPVGLDEMRDRFPADQLTVLAPEQFNRTADGIATLERAGINIEETERQFLAMKRKPGRPRKNG